MKPKIRITRRTANRAHTKVVLVIGRLIRRHHVVALVLIAIVSITTNAHWMHNVVTEYLADGSVGVAIDRVWAAIENDVHFK